MSRRLPWSKGHSDLDPIEKRALLAANELFRGLNADVLAQVEAMTSATTCTAGQVLLEPRASSEVLFLLKKGRVQLYRLSAEGKKLIVAEVKPGGFFGEMAVLGQTMGESFAEAAEDSLLCAMSRTDVQRLLHEHPDIALHVVEHLARRLRDAEAQLETLAYDRLEARLAAVLLREVDSRDQCVRGLSQQEIAEMIGSTRESVTRLLNQMARQGLITIQRREIRIVDAAQVRALMESTEE